MQKSAENAFLLKTYTILVISVYMPVYVYHCMQIILFSKFSMHLVSSNGLKQYKMDKTFDKNTRGLELMGAAIL